MKYKGVGDFSSAGKLIIPTYTNASGFPAAASSKSSLAYANDTGLLYYSNGTIWLKLNIADGAVTISSGGTIVVAAGSLIEVISVEAQSGSRTFKVGSSAGADDVVELTTIPTLTDFSYTINKYTSSALTLYFTITGGTASVIVFTKIKN